MRQYACVVFWHNKPACGILEGKLFTDGSSCGLTGWALVATNAEGKLISAAHGPVSVNKLLGQTSRWRGLRVCHGRIRHFRPRHPSHRPRGHCGGNQGTLQEHLGSWRRACARMEQSVGNPQEVKRPATKTEVQKGRATEWQRLGENLLHRFAKTGHTHNANAFFAESLAQQAMLAVEAHVILRRREQRQHHGPPRAPSKRKKRARGRSLVSDARPCVAHWGDRRILRLPKFSAQNCTIVGCLVAMLPWLPRLPRLLQLPGCSSCLVFFRSHLSKTNNPFWSLSQIRGILAFIIF